MRTRADKPCDAVDSTHVTVDGPVMRVLVAAPPKTGNVWLERLLSLAFGFQWIREAPTVDYWGAKDVGALRQFLASGRLPKMTICHQHFWPSEELFDVAVTGTSHWRRPCGTPTTNSCRGIGLSSVSHKRLLRRKIRGRSRSAEPSMNLRC
jgi:hypothetical protein